MMKVIEILIEPQVGDRIEDTICEAYILAVGQHCPVVFCFNGINLKVNYGDWRTIRKITLDYYQLALQYLIDNG